MTRAPATRIGGGMTRRLTRQPFGNGRNAGELERGGYLITSMQWKQRGGMERGWKQWGGCRHSLQGNEEEFQNNGNTM